MLVCAGYVMQQGVDVVNACVSSNLELEVDQLSI